MAEIQMIIHTLQSQYLSVVNLWFESGMTRVRLPDSAVYVAVSEPRVPGKTELRKVNCSCSGFHGSRAQYQARSLSADLDLAPITQRMPFMLIRHFCLRLQASAWSLILPFFNARSIYNRNHRAHYNPTRSNFYASDDHAGTNKIKRPFNLTVFKRWLRGQDFYARSA